MILFSPTAAFLCSSPMPRHLVRPLGQFLIRAFFIFCFNFVPAVAFAHTGAASGGLLSGLAPPLFGPGPIAAMGAGGVWGALLGPPPLYLLPGGLPLVLGLGGALG